MYEGVRERGRVMSFRQDRGNNVTSVRIKGQRLKGGQG